MLENAVIDINEKYKIEFWNFQFFKEPKRKNQKLS